MLKLSFQELCACQTGSFGDPNYIMQTKLFPTLVIKYACGWKLAFWYSIYYQGRPSDKNKYGFGSILAMNSFLAFKIDDN